MIVSLVLPHESSDDHYAPRGAPVGQVFEIVHGGAYGRLLPSPDDDRDRQGGADVDTPEDPVQEDIDFDQIHGGGAVIERNGYLRRQSLTTITTALDRPTAMAIRARSLSSHVMAHQSRQFMTTMIATKPAAPQQA